MLCALCRHFYQTIAVHYTSQFKIHRSTAYSYPHTHSHTHPRLPSLDHTLLVVVAICLLHSTIPVSGIWDLPIVFRNHPFSEAGRQSLDSFPPAPSVAFAVFRQTCIHPFISFLVICFFRGRWTIISLDISRLTRPYCFSYSAYSAYRPIRGC